MIGVYAYLDHEGHALYVGQTSDMERRDREHWQFGSWRPEACVVEVLSTHETRTDALAAEKEAIRTLRPHCNVANSPGSNRDVAAMLEELEAKVAGFRGATS